MTPEEETIIRDAITIAGSKYANGGVRTYVHPTTGLVSTNYVPFRLYFMSHEFTVEHCNYALKILNTIDGVDVRNN